MKARPYEYDMYVVRTKKDINIATEARQIESKSGSRHNYLFLLYWKCGRFVAAHFIELSRVCLLHVSVSRKSNNPFYCLSVSHTCDLRNAPLNGILKFRISRQ